MVLTMYDTFSKTLIEGSTNIIKSQVKADGFIPFSAGETCDPWNMIEAAMGLAVAGEIDTALTVYDWVQDHQQADGTYCAQYKNGVASAKHTSVHTYSYLSVAMYQLWLINKDIDILIKYWPTITKGIEATLLLQTEYGDIAWSTSFPMGHASDSIANDALVSGCSSIAMSLYRAIELGKILQAHDALRGKDAAVQHADDLRRWQTALDRLVDCLRYSPDRFDRTWPTKQNFAMDWYYPILMGCTDYATARVKLSMRWDEFIINGIGCRCSTDNDWITVAETCELIMVLVRLGARSTALELWSWLPKHANEHGWTQMGYVLKSKAYWPNGEYPTWSAGAILLAADALFGLTPAHGLLLDQIAS